MRAEFSNKNSSAFDINSVPKIIAFRFSEFGYSITDKSECKPTCSGKNRRYEIRVKNLYKPEINTEKALINRLKVKQLYEKDIIYICLNILINKVHASKFSSTSLSSENVPTRRAAMPGRMGIINK